VTTLSPPPELETPPTPDRRKRRIIGMTIWAVVFAVGTYFLGVPTSDPLILFGWLWLASIAWRSDLPPKQHLLFLRDWLPIALLLVIYNVSRGFADKLFQPHVWPMIHADEAMFGGHVPTVWLQAHLYHPGQVPWWMAVVSLIYVSHFLTVPAIAVVLWLRPSRVQWARYMRRWFTLSVAGLVTYFLFPAAPPWWASEHGDIGAVARLSTTGWDLIGLHSAGNTLNALQVDESNPVAAMPSLHTAYAMMAVAFFLPLLRKRWWPLLLAYPLAMTFTLVYSGEHYVLDVLVGWLYVAATYFFVGLAEKWWAGRRALRSPA
jgi:membrane-associated phospholipid phosphatase